MAVREIGLRVLPGGRDESILDLKTKLGCQVQKLHHGEEEWRFLRWL